MNFIADLDITGGNSGSPVLNAQGDLIDGADNLLRELGVKPAL